MADKNEKSSISNHKEGQVLETTQYEFEIENEKLILFIEVNSDNKIHFKLINSNDLSLYYYMNEYNYDDIIKILNLDKEHYKDLQKIFIFINKALSNKKANLYKDKDLFVFKIKRVIDFDEFEIDLELHKNKSSKDEMFNLLMEEITNLKNRDNENNNEKINDLTNIIKEYQNRINILENKVIKLEKIIKENEYKENGQEIRDIINFRENPKNLEFKYELTNKRTDSGYLFNFDVFVGLKDGIEYLIYNNKYNFNLDIMRIDNQEIIRSLEGHEIRTTVIRYFKKNENTDYILSTDRFYRIIIWDIQKNYKIKHRIRSEFGQPITDALLLLNAKPDRDYILITNTDTRDYIHLYAFDKYGIRLDNFIDKACNNISFYLIIWKYLNRHYIIELCTDKISINPIFGYDRYAVLRAEPKGIYTSGYLYNDNFLCVVDNEYNLIRIWDLVAKTIYKQISFDATYGYDIIPWNYKYTIVGCKACIIIIDINEEKVVKKISLNNEQCEIRGLKKIYMEKYGECLIGSFSFNSIKLFAIQDN